MINLNQIVPKISSVTAGLLNKEKVAVDFGTSTVRIAINKKGIVLREASYVGYSQRSKEYLFHGNEAKEIFGKSPNFIEVLRPIEQGIISDFDAGVFLITKLMEKSVLPYYQNIIFLRPIFEAYTAISVSATEVESRATQEALERAGFASVHLFEKPLAAAYGADQPIFSKEATFVLDLGAGLIEMAVIIMGGIVSSKNLHLGGLHMDRILKNYLHLKYGIIIGDSTAEHIKETLLSFDGEKKVLTVRGKSLETGLPKSARVTSSDVQEALVSVINQIIDGVKELIETIPPEIVDGIVRKGAVLTGGLANIPGLDAYITRETKLPIIKAENPQDATIRGLEKLMSSSEDLTRVEVKSVT